MVKTDICAPNNNNNDTCFPDDIISKLAKELETTATIKDIRNKTGCNNDICVASKSKKPTDYLDYFKTPKPESWKDKPNTWLSTLDIDNVLNQYENKYKDFKYFGAVPIDFDHRLISGENDVCVSDDLCKLNIRELWNDGYRNFGFVFNTDRHDQPGQHWISMFVSKNGVYFFDSTSEKPKNEIIKLMNRITDDLNGCLCDSTISPNEISEIHSVYKKLTKPAKKNTNKLFMDTEWLMKGGVLFLDDKPYKILEIRKDHVIVSPKISKKYKEGTEIVEKCWRQFYNDKRHQTGNTECGVYSIYFIINMLEKGDDFLEILENIVDDNKMKENRDIFFRERNEKLDGSLNF
tara:strand:- start:363 stop:1409 length:1047 start_codon:yes stop_codon:yes gene_type:complete